MKREQQVFGQAAETAAEQYLRQKGYRIIERNVHVSEGELDLVAQIADALVFVEVKARRTALFGGVSYAVDRRKQDRLIRLAARYLAKHRLTDRPCRFDVILCKGETHALTDIEHIENAFEVPGEDLRW